VIALNDVGSYVRLALSSSNVWTRPESNDVPKEQETCEAMMRTIEELRECIKERAFLLRKLRTNRQSIVDFDEALFWSCVPLPLKNFVGLLTASEHQFGDIRNNYGHYDLLTKDLFRGSPKCLKIASIAYDIINVQDEKAITPKHLLLGNEIFHHTRSSSLLKMMNHLGHTCGYDTILRLHQEAAEAARQSSNPIHFPVQQKTSHRHDFVIKIADNLIIILTVYMAKEGASISSIKSWSPLQKTTKCQPLLGKSLMILLTRRSTPKMVPW
jgi:hypothetical protein